MSPNSIISHFPLIFKRNRRNQDLILVHLFLLYIDKFYKKSLINKITQPWRNDEHSQNWNNNGHTPKQ